MTKRLLVDEGILVIPAKTGIQQDDSAWSLLLLDSRLRGNDGRENIPRSGRSQGVDLLRRSFSFNWMPVSAGMTNRAARKRFGIEGKIS
jgi:hypothetical protein